MRPYAASAIEFPTMMGKAKAWENASKTWDGERDEPRTSEVVFITSFLYLAKKFEGSTLNLEKFTLKSFLPDQRLREQRFPVID